MCEQKKHNIYLTRHNTNYCFAEPIKSNTLWSKILDKYYKVYSPRVVWNGDVGLNTVIRGFYVTKYTESADRINVFAQWLTYFYFQLSLEINFWNIFNRTRKNNVHIWRYYAWGMFFFVQTTCIWQGTSISCLLKKHQEFLVMRQSELTLYLQKSNPIILTLS